MKVLKVIKDKIYKTFLVPYGVAPQGLVDMYEYFKDYKEGIIFEFKTDNGIITAISTNFKWGTIVTEARTKKELDKNIKDAILTAFEIPSSYAKEAKIERIGSVKKANQYALA